MEISRPRIETQPLSDNRSRFVIEPLEPGFGYTLGNSLRRTLLSSIPGAAVTSIKIDGVLHEFSSIPGVKEDVTDIILNVKELRLRSETNEPATMFLRATGPGEVTAADIVPPADIDVKPKSLETTPFIIARETSGERPVPGWLQVIPNRLRVLVHQLPERAQIDIPLQEQLIVELYSK
jgi:DNA-directed RNA polymerase alpha subunit